MRFWKYLGREYLESKGRVVENNLEEIIDPMTLHESASYFKNIYNLDDGIDVIEKQILKFIEDKYLNEIPLKKGVEEYLKQLYKRGYKMCILTTSDKYQAVEALKRTGILGLFDKVYTDKDFKMSKRSPQIYIQVCKEMNENPQDTLVFEDALYAVKSAKMAQCKVIGVYDAYYKDEWDKILSISDGNIYSFEELFDIVKKL